MTDQSTAPYIEVKIISPRGVVFDGPALSLSSQNIAGKFDILPQHANFITVVQNTPILIRKPDKKTTTFTFPLAVVYNRDNKVTIYIDIQLGLNPVGA